MLHLNGSKNRNKQPSSNLKLWEVIPAKELNQARNNTRLYNFIDWRTAF